MLPTRLTEMLNVKYTIMLAGMAGVSLAEVAAAVSEAGGYGVLGAGNLSPGDITDEQLSRAAGLPAILRDH
jgi:enoyl-[acyl-carrier protein] reductase II